MELDIRHTDLVILDVGSDVRHIGLGMLDIALYIRHTGPRHIRRGIRCQRH